MIKRITISVPSSVAARIKRAAGAMPVSAWLTGIVEEHLEDTDLERLWQEFYRTVRPGGPDVHRADALFHRLTKRQRRRAA